MSNAAAQQPKLGWKFPKAFWFANGAELFERAAYYGMFIALVVYLTDRIGFADVHAGYVAAAFSSVLYLLPTFMGLMADRIGFKSALIVAFSLLTAGYTLLGLAGWLGYGQLETKLCATFALLVIMFGGAIVKPVISATVARCSDEHHRARAFSIFYQVVNIGAFSGKAIAKPLRTGMTIGGVQLSLGLEYINFYAALMALCALVLIIFFYKDLDTKAERTRTLEQVLDGFGKVLTNFRFLALILIVGGFWAIQGQLYATMPKYMLRLVGAGSSPEWLANVNSIVVVLCVVPVTHLIRTFKPASAIGVGLFIMPWTALMIAASPLISRSSGDAIAWLGNMHPITLVVILGAGFQGLAECFLSPKFLEFASRQAPKGEEGLYLGYQHLTTFFAWAAGFAISGHLLDRWCPNPENLDPLVREQWHQATTTGAVGLPEAYANAHYIWYGYAALGFAAFLAIVVYIQVTRSIDRRREAAGATS